jgi:hypothetical protein
MSFLSWFSKVKAKVSTVFVAIFGQEAAQKFGDATLSVLKSAAGVLVLDVVNAIKVANPLVSGDDKRKMAFDKITNDAKAQGLSISSSMINLLIELAVSTINGHIAAQ